MKSMLVIDMPQKCYECPLMSDDMYCNAYAYIVKGRKLCVEDDVLYGERNYGCPLKPMPEKKILDKQLFMIGNFRLIDARFTGWNDCIDETLGEENE